MKQPTPPTPRPWWRRPVVVALLVIAGLVLAVFLAGAWLVTQRPLTVERWAAVRALEKAGLERHAVAAPGGELAVWAGGAGRPGEPAVVLLHGAGDHAGAWAAGAGDLAAEHRLVIPDLPGHGDSAPAVGALPMATVLGGVVALLDSDLVRGGGETGGAAPTADGDDPDLGGPQDGAARRAGTGERAAAAPAPVVVGNSLGGWLGLLVGARHPGLASRLVVVNGGATPGPADPALLVPAERREAEELFALLGAPGPIPGPVLDDVVRRVQHGPMRRFMAADDLADHDLTGLLDAVELPVDLLWGDRDGFFPLTYAEASRDALPAARLTVIEGCGHVPPRYCPAAFAPALLAVLAQEPPTRGEAADAGLGASTAGTTDADRRPEEVSR